jgi:hypothetical protein
MSTAERPALARVVAAALVATMVLAGCGRDPVEPVAQSAPTTPAAPGTTVAKAAGDAKPEAPEPDRAGAAKAAAYFLRTELGFKDPITEPVEVTADEAEIDVRPKDVAEGDRVSPGVPTTVSLRREGGTWVVTGATTGNIEVTSPKPGARVTSPVTVRGRSDSHEGNVVVEVRANRTGKDPELGQKPVTGGAFGMAPFEGEVPYEGGEGAGWVVFFTGSEVDGQILEAAVVPVQLG